MKNAIISVFLFIGLMLGVYFLDNSISKLCMCIFDKCNEIEDILLTDNFEDSYLLSRELLDCLNSDKFITSIYLNHQEFDTLVNEAVKLCIYIENNDVSEAQASLHIVKYNTQNINDLQRASIANIF